MAEQEYRGLLTNIRADGEQEILLPITDRACVRGMEEVDAHVASRSNPHGVTAAQIGAEKAGAISAHETSPDAHKALLDAKADKKVSEETAGVLGLDPETAVVDDAIRTIGTYTYGGLAETVYALTGGFALRSAFTGRPVDVAYGGGIYLSTGDKLRRSTDGKTWEDMNNPANVTAAFFHKGLWVVGSESGISWSNDAAAWTAGTGIGARVNDIVWGNGVWVASADTGMYWSEDGKSWTKGAVPSNTFTKFSHVAYGNNQFMAVGSDGYTYPLNSGDGKNWVTTRSEKPDGVYSGAWFCGDRFFVNLSHSNSSGAYCGLFVYDDAAKIWKATSITYEERWGDARVTEILHTGTLFVAAGTEKHSNTSNKGIWTSTDGVTWTQAFDVRQYWESNYMGSGIAYANGTIVASMYATGASGPNIKAYYLIWSGDNGRTWNISFAPSGMGAIRHCNDLFLFCGGNTMYWSKQLPPPKSEVNEANIAYLSMMTGVALPEGGMEQ